MDSRLLSASCQLEAELTATAGTKFTKPRKGHILRPCNFYISYSTIGWRENPVDTSHDSHPLALFASFFITSSLSPESLCWLNPRDPSASYILLINCLNTRDHTDKILTVLQVECSSLLRAVKDKWFNRLPLIPIGTAVTNRNALHGFNESFQVDSVHDNNAVLKDTNPLAHLEARARS